MTKQTLAHIGIYRFYICAHVHFFTNAKIAQVLPCAILRNVFLFHARNVRFTSPLKNLRGVRQEQAFRLD